MFRVLKRDNKVVDFDIKKISDAIKQAFEACERQTTDNIIDFLALKVTSYNMTDSEGFPYNTTDFNNGI